MQHLPFKYLYSQCFMLHCMEQSCQYLKGTSHGPYVRYVLVFWSYSIQGTKQDQTLYRRDRETRTPIPNILKLYGMNQKVGNTKHATDTLSSSILCHVQLHLSHVPISYILALSIIPIPFQVRVSPQRMMVARIPYQLPLWGTLSPIQYLSYGYSGYIQDRYKGERD